MKDTSMRSSRSLGWLRFIVWAMPSCVFPFVLYFYLPGNAFTRMVVLISAFAVLIYLARFYALLNCQQRQIPPDDPQSKVVPRMVVFVLWQVLLVPAVWFAVVFTLWASTGFSLKGWGC
jgi:hypothetical protein